MKEFFRNVTKAVGQLFELRRWPCTCSDQLSPKKQETCTQYVLTWIFSSKNLFVSRMAESSWLSLRMSRFSWLMVTWPTLSSELALPPPVRGGRFSAGPELIVDVCTAPFRFLWDRASWSFLHSVLVRRRSDSFWALKWMQNKMLF